MNAARAVIHGRRHGRLVFFVLFKWRVVLKMSVRLFRIKASESLEKAQEQELFPKKKTG